MDKPLQWFLGLLFGVAAILATMTSAVAAPPKVVVTIPPVYGLVKSVMTGVAEPTLLVPGNASPHDFSLRPSDVQKIQQADLVFWVGDSLEGFLVKTLAAYPRPAVALINTVPNKWEAREGGGWEPHEHEHGHEGHDEDETDPHIWLDPDNAAAMVNTIAQELAQRDPANADHYRRNAAATIAQLQQLDQELSRLLAADRDKAFIVFHDAFQYFERRYQLKGVGSITVSPESKPSARRMLALRERLSRDQVRCVFSEPQFNMGLVESLTKNTSVRHAVLNPLGNGDYPATLEAIADAMHTCLTAP